MRDICLDDLCFLITLHRFQIESDEVSPHSAVMERGTVGAASEDALDSDSVSRFGLVDQILAEHNLDRAGQKSCWGAFGDFLYDESLEVSEVAEAVLHNHGVALFVFLLQSANLTGPGGFAGIEVVEVFGDFKLVFSLDELRGLEELELLAGHFGNYALDGDELVDLGSAEAPGSHEVAAELAFEVNLVVPVQLSSLFGGIILVVSKLRADGLQLSFEGLDEVCGAAYEVIHSNFEFRITNWGGRPPWLLCGSSRD